MNRKPSSSRRRICVLRSALWLIHMAAMGHELEPDPGERLPPFVVWARDSRLLGLNFFQQVVYETVSTIVWTWSVHLSRGAHAVIGS